MLRGLARLAHGGAGECPDAALVLAWVMMPSATVLAHQLRTLSEDIDCQVAAQLWSAVRTFPWRTTGPVAANLNRNLRKKVLQDLVPTSSPIPHDGDDVVQDDPLPDALEELIEIPSDGIKAEVIGQDDVDLLLAVMDAPRNSSRRRDHRRPGLGPDRGVARLLATDDPAPDQALDRRPEPARPGGRGRREPSLPGRGRRPHPRPARPRHGRLRGADFVDQLRDVESQYRDASRQLTLTSG